MDRLPPEIVHLICEKLAAISIKQVRKFRLVCKAFADIAVCYSLPDVTFYLHHGDFHAIRTIANNAVLATRVRTLIYVPDAIELPGSLTELMNDYSYLHHRKRIAQAGPTVSSHPASVSGDGDGDTGRQLGRCWVNADGCGHSRRRSRQQSGLTRFQLVSHYHKCKSYYQMQRSMLEDDEDMDLMREIIPLFANLRELVMSSSEWGFDYQKHKKHPFDDSLMHFHMFPEQPEGCRALTALIEGLPENVTTRIQKLRAGSLDWRFWQVENPTLSRLRHLAASLTHIEFQILTGYDDNDEESGTEVADCRQALAHGMLCGFFRAAPQLRCLIIDFDDHHPINGYPARLEDLVSVRHCWPHLARLELGDIECDRHQLMAVLRNHSATLRELYLRSISLQNTSWLLLLPDMRDALSLTKAWVCGELMGEDEDSGCQEYWDVVEPEAGSSDRTVSITNYLIQKLDVPCPLLFFSPDPEGLFTHNPDTYVPP